MFDIRQYMKANSVDEAIDLLLLNPDARLIAGGTDVLIRLRDGRDEYSALVDIHGLDALRFIKMDENGDILIGSGTVFTDLIHSEIINAHIPMLAEAADSVGGPQIRNIATIGGNICNGVTSADSASGLFALNAMLQIKGKEGTREIPISEFYLGPSKVDLKPGEILIAFKITRENHSGFTGHYYKYAMRNAMDIATIGCAVSLKTIDGVIKDYRIAYGVAGPVPMRCPLTEKMAVNRKISEALLDDLSTTVIKDVTPRTSWRATREFRLNIIAQLAKRVTQKALSQAGEEI